MQQALAKCVEAEQLTSASEARAVAAEAEAAKCKVMAEEAATRMHWLRGAKSAEARRVKAECFAEVLALQSTSQMELVGREAAHLGEISRWEIEMGLICGELKAAEWRVRELESEVKSENPWRTLDV